MQLCNGVLIELGIINTHVLPTFAAYCITDSYIYVSYSIQACYSYQ